MPSPLDPRAWNRFSYVYGNPVNYTDPSGHIPLPLIGVALIGGAFNVAVNWYNAGSNYTPGRFFADFTIGATFGVLAYGVGAIIGGTSVLAATSRIITYGGLNVVEGYTSTFVHNTFFGLDEQFRLDREAPFAFILGMGGGVFGEGLNFLKIGFAEVGVHLRYATHRTKVINSPGIRNFQEETIQLISRIQKFGAFFQDGTIRAALLKQEEKLILQGIKELQDQEVRIGYTAAYLAAVSIGDVEPVATVLDRLFGIRP